jgi:hypothetical protein
MLGWEVQEAEEIGLGSAEASGKVLLVKDCGAGRGQQRKTWGNFASMDAA